MSDTIMTRKEATVLILQIAGEKEVLVFPYLTGYTAFVDKICSGEISKEQFKNLHGLCNCSLSKTIKRIEELERSSLTLDGMIKDLEDRARKGC